MVSLFEYYNQSARNTQEPQCLEKSQQAYKLIKRFSTGRNAEITYAYRKHPQI